MAAHQTVEIVILLLALALVIGVISSWLRIPYSVALVIAGLTLAVLQRRFAPFTIGPGSLILFLPPLIFEGAWNLDLRALKRMAAPIIVLAGPGVLLAAALISSTATVVGGIPLGSALALGAVLAATDPVAVIAIFRELRVPIDLATLVEGESIANDGIAIVLYQTIMPVAIGMAHPQIQNLVYEFFVSAVGGAAVGFGIAFVLASILRRTPKPMLQVLGTIVAAYGTFAFAESIHVSGIFATTVSAIALKAFEFFPSDEEGSRSVEQFWSVVAFLVNALVFLAMGLTLKLDLLWKAPVLPLAIFIVALGARAIPAYTVLRLFPTLRDRRWSHVVAASGVRGGLAVALALGLPASLPDRAIIIDAVFGVVLLTLLVQGIPMARLVALNTRMDAP